MSWKFGGSLSDSVVCIAVLDHEMDPETDHDVNECIADSLETPLYTVPGVGIVHS